MLSVLTGGIIPSHQMLLWVIQREVIEVKNDFKETELAQISYRVSDTIFFPGGFSLHPCICEGEKQPLRGR
jgi:hypothetical protein